MNEKVIFTNGCFDLIHRGHLELLKYCQKIGTTVIVGMNSDKSARKLKGKNRPINNEQDRKFFLESLKYVDRVFIFDEETPINLIKTIKPDVIVKGGDYKSEKVVGSDLTEVIIFDTIDDYSTTKTIQRITGRR
jgi:D-beta-D-heptose 7-phosphate kinase/D-beta-D-heptose 1-phosphate adenosyltransferase